MNPLMPIESKILSWSLAAHRLSVWRDAGERIVFTNGCFDLLHYGHIQYLAEAKALGDRLVVGLNASASVSRLKGAHRPIKDEKSRAYILAALASVDAVVIFEQDTPLELIQTLRPKILVKGGDWQPEQIVGYDFMMANGGEVRSLNFAEGYSTTALEQKIKGQAEE